MKEYLTHEDLLKRATVRRGGKCDLPCDYDVRHKIVFSILGETYEKYLFFEFEHYIKSHRNEFGVFDGLYCEDCIVFFKREKKGCIIRLMSRLDPSYVYYTYIPNDDLVHINLDRTWTVKNQKNRSPMPFGDIMDLNFPNLTYFKCVGKIREWDNNIIFELDDPITDEEYTLMIEAAKETHHGD